MKSDKNALRLYVVTDRAWTGKESLLEQVEQAICGGATMVQLREKNLEEKAFQDEAREMKQLCGRYQIPFLINDRADIACLVDADGVHVGQHDQSAAEVRKMIGSSKILGVSVQTVEQALLAKEAGADYLGVGAVFPTETKNDAEYVTREVLREICRKSGLPVVAIGGITEQNAETLAGTGIVGIAVISAVFGQPDVAQAAKKLRRKADILSGEGTGGGRQ